MLKERGEGSNKVWFKCQDFTQSYPLGGFKVQSDKLCSKSSSFLRPKSPEGCNKSNKSTPASVFTVLLRKNPAVFVLNTTMLFIRQILFGIVKHFRNSISRIERFNSSSQFFLTAPLLKLIAESEYRGRSTSVSGRSVK